MPSKLGLHVHRPGALADAAIRAAPWAAVKALDATQPLATAWAAGIPIRILRRYGVERLAAAAAAGAFLALDLGAVTHLQLVCEDGRGYDLGWQRDVIAALRAGGYAGAVLGFGFSTGNPMAVQEGIHAGPHFPDWLTLAELFPLLAGVALDQYDGVPVDDPSWAHWLPWTARRHTLVRACLRQHGIRLPPVVVAESGLDGVVPGGPRGGWLARGLSADRYLATLTALDQLDQADPALLCRCVFTLDAPADWRDYEIAGLVEALATYVKGQASVTDYAKARWVPSPNFWQGRQGQSISAIVLHGTAGAGAVDWFANPSSRVSAHYVVDMDGAVTQCVREEDAAWHAGIASADSPFYGKVNENLVSIGIEHVRDVTNTSPVTPEQRAASLDLVRDLKRRRGTLDVLTHDQIQVGRVCPGPDFPVGAFREVMAGSSGHQPGPVDAVTAAAIERFSTLGVTPNTAGAIFAAYVQRMRAWLAAGRPYALDPTPAIRPEWARPDGKLARCVFDNGEIYEWHAAAPDGSASAVYLVEAVERERVWKECGW